MNQRKIRKRNIIYENKEAYLLMFRNFNSNWKFIVFMVEDEIKNYNIL